MFQKNGRYRGMHKFRKDKCSVRIRLILADVAETNGCHSALFQQGRMAPANAWTIDAAQSGLVGQNQFCGVAFRTALGSPVGGGAWSSLAGGPSNS
jgi:hypothetical protein